MRKRYDSSLNVLDMKKGFRPLPYVRIKNGIEQMISRANKALTVPHCHQ